MSPVNPGDRYPEPPLPDKVYNGIHRHRLVIAVIVSFACGVIFGAK